MEAARREHLLNVYSGHVRRFDEIASRRLHAEGLRSSTEVAAAPENEREPAPAGDLDGLSNRERQVLSLLAEGFSNSEIGSNLNITSETVKSHVRNILRRLNARNRTHAVFIGSERGLLTGRPSGSPEPLAAAPFGNRPTELGNKHAVAQKAGAAAATRPMRELRSAATGKGATSPTPSPTRCRRASLAAVPARRLSELPVVAAGSVPGYGPIFNAGVIHHDGRYHLFARAVRDGYRVNPVIGYDEPRFLHYISDLLTFTSADGLHYEFQQLLRAGSPGVVYEDPRVQMITSDGQPRFLLSYTRLSTREPGRPWRAGISELIFDGGAFSLGRELLFGPEQVPNKDVVLCDLESGKIAVIQRLEPGASPVQSIQVATFASLEELWDPRPDFWRRYLDRFRERTILTPSPSAVGIGAGAPPLAVDGELVFFYHERDRGNVYSARVALLDPGTARVRAILPEPILIPELPWERTGDVDNVVFVQGAHLRDDGTIYLTYGAADRHVGAASIATRPLLAALRAAVVEAKPTVRAAA